MSKIRCFVSSALLVLAGAGAACAEEKVLVPGDPPLTQSMVEDYCRYIEWRSPSALSGLGGPGRLGQMLANDWKNEDKVRQKTVLADLNWWRENSAKLVRAEGERLPASNEASGVSDERGRLAAPGADARLAARNQEALHLARLQQWHNARQLQIRALSNLQASHHETMMLIIDNMRPSPPRR
jgi:hypothetical protein